MTAAQKRRFKGMVLGILFLTLVASLFIIMGKTINEEVSYESYTCDEKYVYWDKNVLVTDDMVYTYEEDILNYVGGITETENLYYYGEQSFEKSKIKYITKDAYVDSNNRVYSIDGNRLEQIEYADYVFNERGKIGYISGEYIYSNFNEEPIYLGGNVLQLVEYENKLYLINDYNMKEQQGVLVVYNTEDCLIEKIVQVSNQDRIDQIDNNTIYLQHENAKWKYNLDNDSRGTLNSTENILYLKNCRATWNGENKITFLYLNNDTVLAEKTTEFSVQGMSKE